MPTHCPTCSGAIETDDINVGEGVALCRGCGELHRLTHLLAEPLDDEPADPQSPPRGAWLHQDVNGWRAGANFRGWPLAFLIPFTALWGGFSVGGIYGGQIAKGRFDLGQSLFGLPFLIGTLVLLACILGMLLGRVQVRRIGGRVHVRDGALGVGRSWTFDADEVRGVRLTSADVTSNGRPQQNVTIEGPDVRFGAITLNQRKRAFLLAVLRERLAPDAGGGR